MISVWYAYVTLDYQHSFTHSGFRSYKFGTYIYGKTFFHKFSSSVCFSIFVFFCHPQFSKSVYFHFSHDFPFEKIPLLQKGPWKGINKNSLQHWKVQNAFMSVCTFILIRVRSSESRNSECQQMRSERGKTLVMTKKCDRVTDFSSRCLTFSVG